MTAQTPEIQPNPNSIFRVNAVADTAIARAHGDTRVVSFQEVCDWTVANKPHDFQHLRVFLDVWGYGPACLLTLASEAPDDHTPAPRAFTTMLEWFDAGFPKSNRGKHPRPDLVDVSLARYKKVREGVRRCIRGAMGAYAARAARNEAQDGWRELLDLFVPLIGGPVTKREFGLISKLADIARRAELEPWDLEDADAVEILDAAFVTNEERQLARRAIRQVNDWQGVLEFGDLLPTTGLPPLPTRRATDPLPEHIEKRVDELVATAASRIDINTNEAHPDVDENTRNSYRAALRYHIRLLPHCEPNAEVAYNQPIADLNSVNDVDGLFAPEHISATIRATQDREHLPTAVQADTALAYYKTIAVVFEKCDAASGLPTEIRRRLKSSEYFKGVSRDEMPEHIKSWCLKLLNDPEQERRFWNLHRVFHGKALKLMEPARDESAKFCADRLSDDDRYRVIRLGVCAAICAIILAGRPLRLRNALWLRHRGRRANINPRNWTFFIPAEEAKAGKKIPEMSLRHERQGPQILDWYLAEIRPLLDPPGPELDPQGKRLNPHGMSIYLVPSIRKRGGRINPSTFDIWFQSAANDAGISMTFHKFRTGLASLLIRNKTPLQEVADLLAHTLRVCQKRYAYINPDKSAQSAQDAMIAGADAVENAWSTGK